MKTDLRTPAVRAVVVHEGRFLLAQDQPEQIGKWCIPGGRIETTDANLLSALHRELAEEFTMTADIIGFVGMYMYRDRAHQVFLAKPHTVNFVVKTDEIVKIAWLTLEEIVEWHINDRMRTGFELPAIRASIARYGRTFGKELFKVS